VIWRILSRKGIASVLICRHNRTKFALYSYESLDLIEFEIFTRFLKSLKNARGLIWLGFSFLPDFENRWKMLKLWFRLLIIKDKSISKLNEMHYCQNQGSLFIYLRLMVLLSFIISNPCSYNRNGKNFAIALIWLGLRFLPNFENRWKIRKPWFRLLIIKDKSISKLNEMHYCQNQGSLFIYLRLMVLLSFIISNPCS